MDDGSGADVAADEVSNFSLSTSTQSSTSGGRWAAPHLVSDPGSGEPPAAWPPPPPPPDDLLLDPCDRRPGAVTPVTDGSSTLPRHVSGRPSSFPSTVTITSATVPTGVQWLLAHRYAPACAVLGVVAMVLGVFGAVAAAEQELYTTWRLVFVIGAGVCFGGAAYVLPLTRRNLQAHEALLQREAVRRARYEQNAGRFMPKEFLTAFAYAQPGAARPDHRIEDVAILFSDVRNFTKIAGELDAEHTFEWINNFAQRMIPVIRAHGGFVDKYLGDGMMTVFRVSLDAVNAAVGMQRSVDAFSKSNSRIRRHPITIGVGIHWVRATFGLFGHPRHRMDTVLLGPAISIADTCEGLTKSYGARILITEDVFARLPESEQGCIRRVGKVRFKRAPSATTLYDVYKADPDYIRAYKEEIRAQFEEGLTAHFARNFEAAKELFVTCIRKNLIDKVVEARVYFAHEKLQDPPPDDWEGEDEWALS